MPTPRQANKPRVPTVMKLGELLRAFSTERPSWRVNDLAGHLKWDVATTHRFVKALVEIRLLDQRDSGYHIGSLPFELSAIALTDEPQRAELLRWIEEIRDETNLTTQIGVLDDGAVAILASRESRAAIKAAAMLGARLPLHATAAGKAILIQHPDDAIAALLPPTLEAFTSQTIVDRGMLMSELRAARESGIAGVASEVTEGLDALAIPIPAGFFGSAPAALTCIGLSRSLVPEQWEVAERALRAKAAILADRGGRSFDLTPHVRGVEGRASQ
jgi:IclR family transcriptional regulator, KDG regulon repressor